MIDITSSYDDEVYEQLLDDVTKNIDKYRLSLQVLMAFWDYCESTPSLNLENLEKKIWHTEGQEVEPDISIYEDGERFVFGELKSAVSDLSITQCIEDIKKYSLPFYRREPNVHESGIDPKIPMAVFFITQKEELPKIIDKFTDKYDGFEVEEVPIAFLSFQRCEAKEGIERLRIEFEEGEVNDSTLLSEIKKEGMTDPNTNDPYEINDIILRRSAKDFDFYNADPPDPYMVDRLVKYLSRNRKPGENDVTEWSHKEVVNSFKERHTSEFTEPRTGWIKKGLRVLDDYNWINVDQDEDTIEIRWEEFEKRRQTDDMHKFFAKKEAKKKAEELYEEPQDEASHGVHENQASFDEIFDEQNDS